VVISSMEGSVLPVVRPKNAAATRDAILAAARRRFMSESYENVGLREIAGDVGVDVALVGRYFGGKEKLFAEVLGTCDTELLPPDLPAADLPHFLTRMFMEEDQSERREHVEQLLIILHSASSPAAREIVREALGADLLDPLTEKLSGAGANTRANLAIGILLGATIIRTIMSEGPMCDAKCAMVEQRMARMFEAAMAE
jgi:AcrR family transcriptional regulator